MEHRQGRSAHLYGWRHWRAPDPHDLAWRVFFGALRMPVEYRVGHLRLACVWRGALPDASCYTVTWFWLPSLAKGWLVLPPLPVEEPIGYALAPVTSLARLIGAPLYIATMPPALSSSWSDLCGRCPSLPDDYEGYYVVYPDPGWDHLQQWCQCPSCGAIDVQFEARAARNCGCRPDDDRGHNAHTLALCGAYQAAQACLRDQPLHAVSCLWRELCAPDRAWR